jgi:hypothetical protein
VNSNANRLWTSWKAVSLPEDLSKVSLSTCFGVTLLKTVLVGKKNLEVRPLAVNKGEIVRRLMYENPDADFIFCAGDDKVSLWSFVSIAVLNFF